MLDFVKFSLRTALVTILITSAIGILVLFANIPIGIIYWDKLTNIVGFGKAVLLHWCPEFLWMIGAVLFFFVTKQALIVLNLSLIMIRFILKIWK